MSSVRPLLPTQHLHSQCGGRGSWKGKEQEEGLGQQEFKTNNKKTGSRKKKEKKPTTKKQEALGQIQQEKKNKKPKRSIFGKKGKKKKVLCTFSKFCGETSRYWALFSKISKFFNLLQICVSALDRLFFLEIIAMFQLCHQFANLKFFF